MDQYTLAQSHTRADAISTLMQWLVLFLSFSRFGVDFGIATTNRTTCVRRVDRLQTNDVDFPSTFASCFFFFLYSFSASFLLWASLICRHLTVNCFLFVGIQSMSVCLCIIFILSLFLLVSTTSFRSNGKNAFLIWNEMRSSMWIFSIHFRSLSPMRALAEVILILKRGNSLENSQFGWVFAIRFYLLKFIKYFWRSILVNENNFGLGILDLPQMKYFRYFSIFSILVLWFVWWNKINGPPNRVKQWKFRKGNFFFNSSHKLKPKQLFFS